MAPSPPPSRLIDVHDRTASERVANIGASADFTRVSPVLPSLPGVGQAALGGELDQGGHVDAGLGVKAT